MLDFLSPKHNYFVCKILIENNGELIQHKLEIVIDYRYQYGTFWYIPLGMPSQILLETRKKSAYYFLRAIRPKNSVSRTIKLPLVEMMLSCRHLVQTTRSQATGLGAPLRIDYSTALKKIFYLH